MEKQEKFNEFTNDGLKECATKEFNIKKALFIITFLLIYIPLLVLQSSPLAKDRDFNIFLVSMIIMIPIVFLLIGWWSKVWRR
jgi:hypothetical protein